MALPFGNVKKLYEMKKKADEMKKQMEAIVVEVEEKGIKVVMQGDNHVQEVWVDGELDVRLKEAFNKAVKEAQKKVAHKMQGQMGDFGF
ncbi:YbaB/EbfC family nucleoid-associated protein [Candidatus Parcubacteria bacterium]|nr:YbaB/EbfC family nucleoid-associated protein [Patescibacteria group bacterium]MBU4381132.1 YbaB/EbfC family nucleoid-associated protein [Patescibacteria group bacterium]MCG2689145.1 YbaB/EbfC family nucleoid-associated protein [Candidatus Parcubacteria bacterium]